MKKTVNLLSLVAAFFLLAGLFYACSKESSSVNGPVPAGKQSASIYLTDGPGFFDKVLIDVRSVQVKVDTCAHKDNSGWHEDGNGRHDDDNDKNDACTVWDTLNVTPGVYDLLTLRNGSDTLFANGILPAGKIIQIKIKLGPDNSLVKDSVSYPLNLPRNLDSTIIVKLKGDEWDEFETGHVRLWLDFDCSRSVVRVRDNEFFLNPFIRVFTIKTTGSVAGHVSPKDAFPVITVYNGADSSYALPDKSGDFKLRGLNAGTYSVFVNASNGYADTTITGVTVTANHEVWLGNIQLHK